MFTDTVKTFLFLIGLTALFVWFGSLFGKEGAISALIFAVVINTVAYFFSDKAILGFYNARPLDPNHYPNTYEVVKELTQKMNIPMPTLWFIRSSVANAITTGRNPNHAAVAITSGAFDLLDRKEMRGVLAHELSHIKNRDILFASIASTMATAIGYMAQSLQHATLFGSKDPEHPRNNPIGTAFAGFLMPIAALLMRLAMTRSREYLADESGAYYSHDPLALASAIQKLHDHKKTAHFNPRFFSRAATAELFIVNPFAPQRRRSWINLFLTHPPIDERIRRLKAIYEKMQQENKREEAN